MIPFYKSQMVLYHRHNCRAYDYFTPKEKVQIAKQAGKLKLVDSNK